MLPQIKVYEIDYDFIIKNYLDKELWQKKWTLFVYKDNVFTINLHSINCKNNAITFEINYNKLEHCWYSNTVDYYVDNMSIDILKRLIEGVMFRLMDYYEELLIKASDRYMELYRMEVKEDNLLRDIANEFLDSEGVTNQEIRDAYIDAYVDNNSISGDYTSRYIQESKHTVLTELKLIFTKITKNEKREHIIKEANVSNNIEELNKEIDEFLENLENEEYINELNDRLEAV